MIKQTAYSAVRRDLISGYFVTDKVNMMSDNKEQILNMVLKSDDHPTADDIFYRLRTSGKRVTLATVYNNLHALCEEGKIRKIVFDGKADCYDRPLRHDHLICRCCGKISDITVQDISDMLEKSCGVKPDYYDLKIFYRCDDCRRNNEEFCAKDG
ncbi:MAG: transcriptional repressor [Clostridiales bacterium]|nr:transcriptional repressor [Clostridiales bacterium]